MLDAPGLLLSGRCCCCREASGCLVCLLQAGGQLGAGARLTHAMQTPKPAARSSSAAATTTSAASAAWWSGCAAATARRCCWVPRAHLQAAGRRQRRQAQQQQREAAPASRRLRWSCMLSPRWSSWLRQPRRSSERTALATGAAEGWGLGLMAAPWVRRQHRVGPAHGMVALHMPLHAELLMFILHIASVSQGQVHHGQRGAAAGAARGRRRLAAQPAQRALRRCGPPRCLHACSAIMLGGLR